MCSALVLGLLLASGCRRASPPANPEFSDATVYAFRAFAGDEADLAYALRVLERGTYLGMDVDADHVLDRSVIPGSLTFDDVSELQIPPGTDPADNLAVTVASASAFDAEDHAALAMLPDQRPLEPYSPNHYERTYLDGSDTCWSTRDCDVLLTLNDLIKENALMNVHYEFRKDYRWVDLSLPDPEEGDDAAPSGPPRWAFLARSWQEESFAGNQGANELVQFYSIEVWYPRDGRGFVRDGSETNREDGTWTGDSSGEGLMRVLSLWSEARLGMLSGVSDDLIIGTTRMGIDDNMSAHEEWLDVNVR